MWALSSAGRASALQAECQRFDPVSAHHFFMSGPVVQLVRMPPCHGGDHGFKSHSGRHFSFLILGIERWINFHRRGGGGRRSGTTPTDDNKAYGNLDKLYRAT